MSLQKNLRVIATEPALRAALLFALVAERLTQYYEHGQWLKEGQGATLAADWLTRSGRALPSRELRRRSAASDELARESEASLSREAGLYTAHEMNESLDPNFQSEIGQSFMDECRRRIEAMDKAGGETP
jgi:hypothetical protein